MNGPYLLMGTWMTWQSVIFVSFSRPQKLLQNHCYCHKVHWKSLNLSFYYVNGTVIEQTVFRWAANPVAIMWQRYCWESLVNWQIIIIHADNVITEVQVNLSTFCMVCWPTLSGVIACSPPICMVLVFWALILNPTFFASVSRLVVNSCRLSLVSANKLVICKINICQPCLFCPLYTTLCTADVEIT